MKTLRGILLFILAMLLGIILFVVAIGGAIYGVINNVTVGEIQDDYIHKDVISPDSQLYGQTILQAIQQVLKDVKDTSNLSFKTLYEHYGLKLLNGVEGLDFTTKPFYSAPLTEILKNPKEIIKDFTVNDVSIIAKRDFGDYDIPLLNDNLDMGILDFFDYALNTVSGDLTVRLIKDQLGIDLGIEDNVMIEAVQDVPLTEFGKVINAMYLNTLLQADTDVFVKQGENPVYGKVDIFEEVSADDLKNLEYQPAIGVETYVCGAIEPVNADDVSTLETKELRYIKKVSNEPGSEGEEYYVVDNSCYAEDFNADENEKVFYRHILYLPYSQLGDKADEFFVPAYYNRVVDVNGNEFELLSAGFQSLKEIYTQNESGTFVSYNDLADGDTIVIASLLVEVQSETPDTFATEQSEQYTILTPDKDSKLQVVEEPTEQQIYLRAHVGTTTPVVQAVAHLTVEELQNADGLLDNVKIGDIVDVTEEGTSKILVALKDSTLKTIGKDVNDLTLSQMIDINMTEYEKAEGTEGKYALVEDTTSYVAYDKDNEYMQGLTRYTKNEDGSFVEDANGKYVHPQYFTLYNPAVHGSSVVTYNEKAEQPADVSSKLLQRFANATMDGIDFDGLILADVIDMDPDHYIAVDREFVESNPGITYYVFKEKDENGKDVNVYTRWDKTSDGQLYMVSKEGENTEILKRLAYAKIDTLSDSMECVIDDLLVSEIVDIYKYSAVSESANQAPPTSAEDPINDAYDPANESIKYFLPLMGTETTLDENGVEIERPYTYVYDRGGRYMQRPYQLVSKAIDQIDVSDQSSEIKYFKYVKINDKVQFAQYMFDLNVYYKATTNENGASTVEYVHNIPLAVYLASQDKFDNLYYRVLTTADDAEAVSSETIQNSTMDFNGETVSKYYVNINGVYIPYDSENIVHLDRNEYYMFVAGNCFVSITENGLTDSYRFKDGVDALLAKKYCDNVYFKDPNGGFVYIGGEYVAYNETVHSGEDSYRMEVGYVASFGEAFVGSNGNYVSFADWKRVDVIREQSVPVMRLFANATLNNLNDVVKEATINNIMDIEPGSIMAKFENATLLTLDNEIATSLTDLTVGELLEWSAITNVDKAVINALKDVTLKNFFASLRYNEAKGIYVDMEIACGYNSGSNVEATA